MPRITAKFEFRVSSPCLVQWPDDGTEPETVLAFDDFEIALQLIRDRSQATQMQGERYFTRVVEAIKVIVSKEQPSAPPPPEIDSEGRNRQNRYLDGLLPAYRSAALKAANGTLRFFRYYLHTPSVIYIPEWEYSASNPIWLDESGVRLSAGGYISFQPIPGSRGELGVTKLTSVHLPTLTQYIALPEGPSLAEELLADAQSAWFDGHLRRSILELAICTETTVKRKFFARASAAGAAFDYFEDKSRISVRVLELLDAVAKEAFSRSYKIEHPSEYQQIDTGGFVS